MCVLKWVCVGPGPHALQVMKEKKGDETDPI